MEFLYIGILIIFVGIGLLLYMWSEAFRNKVYKQTLTFDRFPKGLGEINIFFISDIHRRVISPEIFSQLNEKVDLVIIGGDLCEKGVSFEKIKQNIIELRKLAPTYFVWGNNDYEVDHHRLDLLLLDENVKILDNTAVTFESEQGEKISLLGVDDLKCGRHRLDLALMDAGDDVVFKILACHNPEIMDENTSDHDIDLVLSGHTHGGQIRLFNMGLYEKGGIEKKGSTTLLVSNGYGTTKLPLRLGAPPETHLITIKHT